MVAAFHRLGNFLLAHPPYSAQDFLADFSPLTRGMVFTDLLMEMLTDAYPN
ncbi:hypothetical protein CFII64_22725 [Pseudomonas sp. CFII64]|jgi:hypothetical protein|uniref:hypothetical protein n=1 Tax=Pseudomonas sp. CFII64 TaxID=911242 RepID=UPI000357E38B|nr:hypothetical protein [Pseudomonas sp. CFII64]EPJ78137.1 hypothetical protein CFII64_22725 [Pseudomonas sp. CFII64]